MKTFVVIDHICEADVVIGVFSSREKAEQFIKEHKDDLYSPSSRMRTYEGLDIEEHELDGRVISGESMSSGECTHVGVPEREWCAICDEAHKAEQETID